MVRFVVGLQRSYAVLLLVALIATASLVSSLSVSADPGNGNDPIGKVLAKLSPETRKLIVRGPNNTFSIRGQVADKQAVINEIDQAFKSVESSSGIHPMCTANSLCGDHSKNGSSTIWIGNDYVNTSNYFHAVGQDVPNDPQRTDLIMDGNQRSVWSGSNPYNADSITINTSVHVDVGSPTFQWSLPPVGWTFQGTTAYANAYTVYNYWQTSSSYSGLSIRAGGIGPYASQTDSAEFVFGPNHHTTISTINLP